LEIRRRSNLGHIFRGKKSVSYGPGNMIIRWQWNVNHLLLCWQIETYLRIFYTKKLLWHAEHLSRMSVATLVLYK